MFSGPPLGAVQSREMWPSFAAGVALHGLGLAVAGEVVGAAALVACG